MNKLLIVLIASVTLASSLAAFDACEWLIAVKGADADSRVFLPNFIETRRQRAVGDGPPGPHGGLIFTGKAPNMLDVVVTLSEHSSVAAAWPAAKTRANAINWSALKPIDVVTGTTSVPWWQALRADHPVVGNASEADSVLYYDADLSAVHDYRLDLDDKGNATIKVRPEAVAPAAAWLLRPANDNWFAIPATPEKAIAKDNSTGTPMTDLLARQTASLPPQLAAHLRDTIAASLPQNRVAALLRLPSDSKHVTCEILPLPDKHQRFLYVVLLEYDDRSAESWATLIAELGDPKWRTREAAFATISEAGEPALTHLNKALKSDNLEIVDRAERLIMRLGHDPDKIGEKLKSEAPENGIQGKLSW